MNCRSMRSRPIPCVWCCSTSSSPAPRAVAGGAATSVPYAAARPGSARPGLVPQPPRARARANTLASPKCSTHCPEPSTEMCRGHLGQKLADQGGLPMPGSPVTKTNWSIPRWLAPAPSGGANSASRPTTALPDGGGSSAARGRTKAIPLLPRSQYSGAWPRIAERLPEFPDTDPQDAAASHAS